MDIHITNLCPAFFAFWDATAHLSVTDQQVRWRTQYEDAHRPIFDVYYGGYGQPDNLARALAQFGPMVPTLRVLVPTVPSLIEHVAPRCAQLFGHTPAALPYVLMVGLFTSDAWVTRLHDTPTAFFALEVPWHRHQRTLAISIAHETAHLLHQHGGTFWTDTPTVGEAVFMEGLAILAATVVTPDAPEAAYLWPGGDRTSTGQACSAWVNECDQQWGTIRHAVLHDLHDSERVGSYFYVYPNVGLRAGVPMRAGYVLGYRLVRALYQHYSIADMARWSADRVATEVAVLLEQMPNSPNTST